MGIMTIMMGNMPQVHANGTATDAGSVPSPVGDAGDISSGGSSFLQLLGTSIQSKLPVSVLGGEISAEADTTMESFMATASVAVETDTSMGGSVSVKNILNELRTVTSEQRTGMELLPKTEDQGVALLLELQKLAGLNAELTPELQSRMQGVFNPVVAKQEELGAQIPVQIDVESSNEQNANEMASELVASLNALLNHAQVRRTPEIRVSDPNSSEMSGMVSVGMQEQAKPENCPVGQQVEQNFGPKVVKANVDEAFDISSNSAVIGSTAEIKGVNQPKLQTKSVVNLKIADAAAMIDLRIREDARQPVSREGEGQSDARQAAEETVNPELVGVDSEQNDPIALKPDPGVSLKAEPLRSDFIVNSQSESKVQHASDSRTTETDSTVTVSHEQIMSQVKEKLTQQRLTSDNGQITLRLHPAELGELKVTVRMDDQRVRVDVVAENRMVKDALMQNLDSLKEALARQNVAMERFDVSTGGRQFFDQGFREGQRQEQQQFVSRGAAWLTGRNNNQTETVATQWTARENSLLDMMM